MNSSEEELWPGLFSVNPGHLTEDRSATAISAVWVFFFPMDSGRGANLLLQAAILVLLAGSSTMSAVSGLGSMSTIAVSYGENGPVFCGLSPEGSHQVACYGADASIVYGAPSRLPFLGITAGDGFVCGLLMGARQPYCWGNNIYVNMGVPQPMVEGVSYSEISAGDHHLCGLRRPSAAACNTSLVDCWGYNMTASHAFPGGVRALTAGSSFNCALFVPNQTATCWGDETGSNVITSAPGCLKFRTIAAGGFHVCGVLESSRVSCWGKSLNVERISPESLGDGEVSSAPADAMISVAGGRFHACGIRSVDRAVVCWGFRLASSVPPPAGIRVYEIAAGDYFTCGVLAESSLKPLCWGTGFPMSIPMAVSPGLCISTPCGAGFYEFTREKIELCRSPDSRVCLPCSGGCPDGTYQLSSCSSRSDRRCEYNCSSCASPECSAFCSSQPMPKNQRSSSSLQMPIFVGELVAAAVLVAAVSLAACLYVRHKLRRCRCSAAAKEPDNRAYSFHKDRVAAKGRRPDLDEELKIRRARMFSYEELDRATGGFSEESQVGKGSFSCVFKGVLGDGTVVAVKRAVAAPDPKTMAKNSKEFRTELDLLSRLNHAHLLNLLGFCEEGGERLLVYEFMAHGSLHQHLHGKDPGMKERLDWVRRVTIAVQAARGIEYLHGYACPPVIHRDIKSSNILIDEEHNARVADFGLSLLGPADSSSPLSELPAGTLGYLDPEYYRLHYLTTKSDVYSFGVLLLEILSGRKAIDMGYEEGNIVEWAVPLIRAGDVAAVLDPALRPPAEAEALRRIAATACKCVRMRGKERPSMDQVTTALERALALLMGSPCNEQPILPTEVVLGSSRLHKKGSQRSTSNPSCSETTEMAESEDQRFEFRAPSWITFPSVTSSQRRKSSVSEADADPKNTNTNHNTTEGIRNHHHPHHHHQGGTICAAADGVRCPAEEEIGPASPQEHLFLQHNF